VIGRSGSTGGFRVHRYVDRDGRECAYYDTTLLFPMNALSLSAEPTGVAVLDMSEPSKPVRTTTLITPAASVFGHESGMALDGRTFYPTSISTGHTTAVDLTNPRTPLPIWQGQFNTHGMSVSDDGNRGYLAARDGLIIVDLSEVQARKPNPQVTAVVAARRL
jgi:hypothetical protein